MREYYDVMYSESYGWWTFAMAFDAPKKKQQEALRQYEFSGIDDLGVSISCDGNRVTVAIHCHADTDSLYELGHGAEDYGYDDDEEDAEDEGDEGAGVADFESEDGLLNFEAGAIAAKHEQAKVCGFVTGVSVSQLGPGPIGQFQCVEADSDGICQLGLIEARGHRGEVFAVTAEGYRVADELAVIQSASA
jgi:hypothetical protein